MEELHHDQDPIAGLRHLPIAIVGPYPPLIGGTSAFLSGFVPALETVGAKCTVFNTLRGDPGKGIAERIRRLLWFVGLAYRVSTSHCLIVHCHAVNWQNLLGHALVMTAARLAGKTVVLTLHAGDLEPQLLNSWRWVSGGLLNRLPHAITAVTPNLSETVTSLGAVNVTFVPNDLFQSLRRVGGREEVPAPLVHFATAHRPLIVVVGAFGYVHGIDVLVRAMALLKLRNPNIGAIVVAYKFVDVRYRSEVQSLIAQCNLEASIVLPESLPDVLSVVAMADVFVRPTRSDGDSMAVREALALGVRVVASQTGFRPNGCILFPPGDHVQLAEAISSALSSPRPSNPPQTAEAPDVLEQYMRVYSSALDSSQVVGTPLLR